MADAPKEPYSVEDPEPRPQDDAAHGETPAGSPSGAADESSIDDMVAVRVRCEECGATIDPGEEVCIRCGFVRSRGEAAAQGTGSMRQGDESREDNELHVPISPTGESHAFETWLPVALGIAALATLVIGLLAGVIGLFPQLRIEGAEAVPWSVRFVEVLRNLVLLAFWTGCGLAGLFGLSLMFERPLGDARLAMTRMVSITATIRLATFLSIPGPRWVEWMTEALLQAAGFVLLSMLLFRLSLRSAGVLALWTLLTILVLWLFTYAVQWALGG